MTATHLQLRFVSSNHYKTVEVQEILAQQGISVIPVELKIEELQTTDTKKLVYDKLLKAFREIGRPLFVEHTGLYVEGARELPGGLTQIFWDALGPDAFATLFGSLSSPSQVIARTWIAYCDGRKILDFDGEIAGELVSPPRGPQHFQWDCVFQPDGMTQTFAELGQAKNTLSMRRIALDKFAEYLTANNPV